MQKATERTNVQSGMPNAKNEVFFVARWKEKTHVQEIVVTDRLGNPISKREKLTLEYGGKDAWSRELKFVAKILPEDAKIQGREDIVWSSSNPDIIYIQDGEDKIITANLFSNFWFGTDVGEVVLTATSIKNPSVKFDINVTVVRKDETT